MNYNKIIKKAKELLPTLTNIEWCNNESFVEHVKKHPIRERKSGKWDSIINYRNNDTISKSYLKVSKNLSLKSNCMSSDRYDIQYCEEHDSINIVDNSNNLICCLKYRNNIFNIVTCFFPSKINKLLSIKPYVLINAKSNIFNDKLYYLNINDYKDAIIDYFGENSIEYNILFENAPMKSSDIDNIVKEIDNYLSTIENKINTLEDKKYYFVYNDGLEYIVKMSMLYKIQNNNYDKLYSKFINIDINNVYKYTFYVMEKYMDLIDEKYDIKEIDIKKFNVDELNDLKKILELKTIDSIEALDPIISKNKIVIKHIIGKDRICLNNKYRYFVDTIRNKYFYTIKNVLQQFDEEILDAKDILLGVSKILNEKIYLSNLTINVINYIGTYNFDNIFELKREEMLHIKKLNNNNNNITECEALGLYCHNSAYIIDALKDKVSKKKLNEIMKCRKMIFICPELINEYCDKYYKSFEVNKSEFKRIIYNKVLVHEIGHAVFDYLNDDNNERRANYFVSSFYDSTYDDIIKEMTNLQGGNYKNPYTINHDLSDIIKTVYKIDK